MWMWITNYEYDLDLKHSTRRRHRTAENKSEAMLYLHIIINKRHCEGCTWDNINGSSIAILVPTHLCKVNSSLQQRSRYIPYIRMEWNPIICFLKTVSISLSEVMLTEQILDSSSSFIGQSRRCDVT
jgi:hypothetical protein